MMSPMRLLLILLATSMSTSVWAQADIVRPPGGTTPGPLTIASSATVTLDLPPDGKLFFSSINIGNNAQVFFRANALNTPVYLLSTGDVVINSGATVSVQGWTGVARDGGSPGPGGFGGGAPNLGGGAGAGKGPGGGAPGVFGSHVGGPRPYGTNLAVPLVGGSGGGGALSATNGGGGGGGGGAILIASNTSLQLSGRINAFGGDGCCANGGSAGTIRLLAPRVAGNAILDVSSRSFSSTGRCRADTIDRSGLGGVTCSGGTLIVGSFLAVEPTEVPTLDLLEVAGRAVAGGAAATITLSGASSTQPVRLIASKFPHGGASVTIRTSPTVGDATIFGPFTVMNGVEFTTDITLPPNNTISVELYGQDLP